MPALLRSAKFAAALSLVFAITAAVLFFATFQNFTHFSNVNHRPHIAYKEGLATNWAGYAAATNLNSPKPGSVSDVKASWTVPALRCDRRTTYSAMWTGIDGYTSATVEQLGTEHDCYRGQSYYTAWYEIYPDALTTIPMKIKAGDHVSAEVEYQGNDQFLLTIQDGTQFYSTKQTVVADRSSAEWIVEAPSLYTFVLPLANFGTAKFTNAAATINGHSGSPIDSSWQNDPLTMVTWYGAIKAYPSAVGANGAFDVTWNHR